MQREIYGTSLQDYDSCKKNVNPHKVFKTIWRSPLKHCSPKVTAQWDTGLRICSNKHKIQSIYIAFSVHSFNEGIICWYKLINWHKVCSRINFQLLVLDIIWSLMVLTNLLSTYALTFSAYLSIIHATFFFTHCFSPFLLFMNSPFHCFHLYQRLRSSP